MAAADDAPALPRGSDAVPTDGSQGVDAGAALITGAPTVTHTVSGHGAPLSAAEGGASGPSGPTASHSTAAGDDVGSDHHDVDGSEEGDDEAVSALASLLSVPAPAIAWYQVVQEGLAVAIRGGQGLGSDGVGGDDGHAAGDLGPLAIPDPANAAAPLSAAAAVDAAMLAGADDTASGGGEDTDAARVGSVAGVTASDSVALPLAGTSVAHASASTGAGTTDDDADAIEPGDDATAGLSVAIIPTSVADAVLAPYGLSLEDLGGGAAEANDAPVLNLFCAGGRSQADGCSSALDAGDAGAGAGAGAGAASGGAAVLAGGSDAAGDPRGASSESSSAVTTGPTPRADAPLADACGALLCTRGQGVSLLADTSVRLYSTDFVTPGVVEVGSSYTIATCECTVRDTACVACGSVAGYHVTRACRGCLSDANNSHYWMFHAAGATVEGGRGGGGGVTSIPRLKGRPPPANRRLALAAQGETDTDTRGGTTAEHSVSAAAAAAGAVAAVAGAALKGRSDTAPGAAVLTWAELLLADAHSDFTAAAAVPGAPGGPYVLAPSPWAAAVAEAASVHGDADADTDADALMCPVCYDPMVEAVTLSPCGHTYCRACAVRACDLQHACPLDRSPVAHSDIVACDEVSARVRTLRVWCRFACIRDAATGEWRRDASGQAGCDAVVCIGARAAHEVGECRGVLGVSEDAPIASESQAGEALPAIGGGDSSRS